MNSAEAPALAPERTHLYGLAITLSGVIILSPDSALIRGITGPALLVTFWRGLLIGLVILGFFLIRQRGRPVELIRGIGWNGLGVACSFAFGTTMFVTAIKYTVVANALIILSGIPLLAALLSLLVLKEHIALRTWLTIAAAMVGMGIIFWDGLGTGNWVGNLAALGCALAGAIEFVLIRRAKAINLVPAIGVGGLIIAFILVWFVDPWAILPEEYGTLALMGLIVQPLSFALITLGPRYLTAPEVGLIMLLETLLGPLWVWWFHGEVPPTSTYWGGGIVLGALVLNALSGMRSPAR